MATVATQSMDEADFRSSFFAAALAAGIVFAALFLAFPDIDLAVSGAVRDLCGGDARHSGWCHEDGVMRLPRNVAILFTVVCALAAIAAIVRVAKRSDDGARRQRLQCLFLLSAFVLGPGVVANLVFKDQWGRARPREVVEFGGSRNFTPPLLVAGQCHDNCSFVSGEASAVYTPFFAAAMIFPQVRITMVAGGLIAGTATGLVRISTGGHFLSDVLFAGVFMALLVFLMHVVLINTGLLGQVMAKATAWAKSRPGWLVPLPEPGSRLP